MNNSYEAQRKAAIAVLKRAFGDDATIPLEMAAAVLPQVPEWDKYIPRNIRKKKQHG